ncbi:MAG: NAD(P)(+) transhydrogenase (Re/Si-specific) subunit alpha, partial [Rhodobacteraceae bacterium]|nr:NAD(P)(+) transhydrogenase (Re/Si-specific) subunit alpha [Paracoccaceae bacterium]
MQISVLKERRPDETRVAATPDTVKKFVGLGCKVVVESGAGKSASISDDDYKAAGAEIAGDAAAACASADVVVKVQRPMTAEDGGDEIGQLKSGSILMAGLNALTNKPLMEGIAKQGVTAFALELMPRISRAQKMDVLSSMSTISGYKGVLLAASELNKMFPMMMTAAGTITPAKVLILGAGVAGLQAIATAKR